MRITLVKKKILQLYEYDNSIVNDDNRPICHIWYTYGWTSDRSLYSNLSKVPSSDTIRRARRALHQEGKIVYSPSAESNRYKRYKDVTIQFSNYCSNHWHHRKVKVIE